MFLAWSSSADDGDGESGACYADTHVARVRSARLAITAAHRHRLADLLAADAGPVRGAPMMAGDLLPLDGIRVLDLSGPVGSYGGRLLADIGADVVKVELPAGDELRRQGPFAGRRSDPERSLTFAYYHANKRGIVAGLPPRGGARRAGRAGRERRRRAADPAGGGLRPGLRRAVLGRRGCGRLRGHAVRAHRPLPHLARHPPHVLRAGRRHVLPGAARRAAGRHAGPPAV